jgi:hypothetical protein
MVFTHTALLGSVRSFIHFYPIIFPGSFYYAVAGMGIGMGYFV